MKLKPIIRNKRGQSVGLIVFLIVGIISVFVLYLIAVPLAQVWDDISDKLHSPTAFGDNSTAGNRSLENVEKLDSLITPAFDGFVFIGLIAIILTLMVSAIFFNDHPVFIIFIFLGIMVAVIIVAQLANVAEDIRTDQEINESTGIADKATEFKLSNLVIGKQLPIIVLLAGVVSILIMLSKTRSGGGA